jgi:hypothetical protein
VADWTEGLNSKDYPNYDKLIGGLSKETFETQAEKGAAWVGTPETIAKQIRDYQQMVGGFEIASMQVNFSAIPLKDAERSMRLFRPRGHSVSAAAHLGHLAPRPRNCDGTPRLVGAELLLARESDTTPRQSPSTHWAQRRSRWGRHTCA